MQAIACMAPNRYLLTKEQIWKSKAANSHLISWIFFGHRANIWHILFGEIIMECCGPGYASPQDAIAAPREKLLYTIAIYTGTGIQKPDYLATIDTDPKSASYSKVIHRLNMPGIGDAVSLGIEANYDLMKIFHQNKPTNSTTGRKNPTVINGSWGYQAAFSSGNTVTYKFQGSTGTFTGNASVSNQVTAMKDGLNNQVTGAYRSWSTSSRSNSIDTAATEMMATGVIYIAAAGNNNQRLGVGANDVDRLNYMSDNYYSTTDPRSEFPSGTVPCNHRDWMNPQGNGFDSTTDFHPTICVGAMEEYVANGSLPYSGSTALAETKASYSNNGPGIDVWAPADETLSAGTNGVSSYEDFARPDDGINYTSSTTGSDYFDTNFNGTSAAAPVVTGLIALYLESNPTATSRQVKDFLFEQGSVVVADALYADQYSDDSQTTYWTGSYNMRGAQKRILRDKTASPTEPSIKGVTVTGISFKQS